MPQDNRILYSTSQFEWTRLDIGRGYEVVQWQLTGSTAITGGPYYPGASFPDKTVHVTVIFAGATLVIEGSLFVATAGTGASWVTLADPQGNALSFTSTGAGFSSGDIMETVLENVHMIRPRLSGGSAATDTTIRLLNATLVRD